MGTGLLFGHDLFRHGQTCGYHDSSEALQALQAYPHTGGAWGQSAPGLCPRGKPKPTSWATFEPTLSGLQVPRCSGALSVIPEWEAGEGGE